MATGFWNDFRRFFTRGLAAILPTVLTLALIIWLFNIVNTYIGQHISDGAKYLATAAWRAFWSGPADWNEAWNRIDAYWADHYLDVVGFTLAIVLIYVVGLFVASFIGRSIWRGIELLLMRLPLIRQIYPSVKQVTDFLFSEKRLEFSRVVAVEYPRKGIWSMGLVTNSGMRSLRLATGCEMLTVFIPSTPTPVTGFTITVRRDEVVDLPWTIDEAFRLVVSGGVIMPAAELVVDAPAALVAGSGALAGVGAAGRSGQH